MQPHPLGQRRLWPLGHFTSKEYIHRSASSFGKFAPPATLGFMRLQQTVRGSYTVLYLNTHTLQLEGFPTKECTTTSSDRPCHPEEQKITKQNDNLILMPKLIFV